MKKIATYIIILATLWSTACTRSEELVTPYVAGNNLVVKTELIGASDWVTTRAEEPAIYGSASESTDGEYLLTATKQEWTGAADTLPDNAPVTRGKPIGSAAGIANLRVNVFNTGASNWSTASTRTAAIDATNVSGSFTTTPIYNWITDATVKTSLFAYSPLPNSSNGLTDVAPNKITYTVPTDVTKQPDLCVATPQMNVINDDGAQQVCTFALRHQLTAVGFTMLGWKLQITKITVSGVSVAGTLTMNSSGTNTWSNSTTGSRDVGVTGASYLHNVNNSYADITTSDGYLMMIPQTLSSSAQVTITYTSTGAGSTSGSITASLKDLGLTWNAGDKIIYNIRLKTAPAVTSGDLKITNDLAGFTTSNPLSMVMDNKDNLTFTWDASWLKIHRGNPKAGDTSGGAVSGWQTSTGGPWSNIYFFAANNNTSEIADRTATVTVTGTRSGISTFKVQQTKKVKVNPVNPPTADQYIYIRGWYWAKGNLVASNSTAGNMNGCKIGNPSDAGLYFQFGSLIGWKGGNPSYRGTGQGTLPYKPGYWGGASSFSWGNDAMVWPAAMTYTPRAWPSFAAQATEANAFQQWHFDFSGTSGGVNYSANSSNIRAYTHPTLGALKDGKMASLGIGDPCTYYLGATWRQPTIREFHDLFDWADYMARWYLTKNWSWVTSPYYGAVHKGGLYLPAGFYRLANNGTFGPNLTGAYWSSSTTSNITGGYANFDSWYVMAYNNGDRTSGYPVRCVSDNP